jgi:hypothetical protein
MCGAARREQAEGANMSNTMAVIYWKKGDDWSREYRAVAVRAWVIQHDHGVVAAQVDYQPLGASEERCLGVDCSVSTIVIEGPDGCTLFDSRTSTSLIWRAVERKVEDEARAETEETKQEELIKEQSIEEVS